MFGDKSSFGSSKNGQNMLKKGQQEKYVFVQKTRVNYPLILCYKKVYILNSL